MGQADSTIHVEISFRGLDSLRMGADMETKILNGQFDPLPDYRIRKMWMEEVFDCDLLAAWNTPPYSGSDPEVFTSAPKVTSGAKPVPAPAVMRSLLWSSPKMSPAPRPLLRLLPLRSLFLLAKSRRGAFLHHLPSSFPSCNSSVLWTGARVRGRPGTSGSARISVAAVFVVAVPSASSAVGVDPMICCLSGSAPQSRRCLDSVL